MSGSKVRYITSLKRGELGTWASVGRYIPKIHSRYTPLASLFTSRRHTLFILLSERRVFDCVKSVSNPQLCGMGGTYGLVRRDARNWGPRNAVHLMWWSSRVRPAFTFRARCATEVERSPCCCRADDLDGPFAARTSLLANPRCSSGTQGSRSLSASLRGRMRP
jgi:hypothetical protein